MTPEERDYFIRRERQERAAAKRAESLAARRAHQHMACSYAAILQLAASNDPVPLMRACGGL